LARLYLARISHGCAACGDCRDRELMAELAGSWLAAPADVDVGEERADARAFALPAPLRVDPLRRTAAARPGGGGSRWYGGALLVAHVSRVVFDRSWVQHSHYWRPGWSFGEQRAPHPRPSRHTVVGELVDARGDRECLLLRAAPPRGALQRRVWDRLGL